MSLIVWRIDRAMYELNVSVEIEFDGLEIHVIAREETTLRTVDVSLEFVTDK